MIVGNLIPSGHLLSLHTVDTLKNFVKMPRHACFNDTLQNLMKLDL